MGPEGEPHRRPLPPVSVATHHHERLPPFSTLHRYSIGCSLAHPQSQCFYWGGREEEEEVEEEITAASACQYIHENKSRVVVTVGPLLCCYKQNH